MLNDLSPCVVSGEERHSILWILLVNVFASLDEFWALAATAVMLLAAAIDTLSRPV